VIIGVDPGDTTGIVKWKLGHRDIEFAQLKANQVAPYLRPMVRDNTLVVCERFVIGTRTVRKKRSPATTDTIGAVRALCEEQDARFVLQSSSDAKTFGVNDLLKKLGWYVAGQRHAMDAARHTLLAIAREHPNEFDRLTR